MEVLIGAERVRVDPRKAFGKGGEADVYDLGDGRALKLYKTDAHPDIKGLAAEEQAARARQGLQQRKLPAFPKGLPAEVVAPQELALAVPGARGRSAPPAGLVLGYTMPLVRGAEPLLRWAEPVFRRAGATSAQAAQLFSAFHGVLHALHARGVQIGDCNDANLLVQAAPGLLPKLSIIDADSFQFGGFPCPVFTERFLDPRLCDRASGQPVPRLPHDDQSDWFAYAALLCQTLLLVGPWGGIHRPRDPSQALNAHRRMLERLSIFSPGIQLPKAAAPRESLPDDLLHALAQVFEHDVRAPLPLPLVQGLAFVACASCGLEHARAACPRCRPHAAAAVVTVVASRGAVTAQTLFETPGALLAAAYDGPTLRHLHHLRGRYLREDQGCALVGPLDPGLQFGLAGGVTAVAKSGKLVLLREGSLPRTLCVDDAGAGGSAVLASNGTHLAWSQGGQLFCAGEESLLRPEAARGLWLEPEPLGTVLGAATRLFLGPAFGLGLTRAGALTVAFTFTPGRRGLHEELGLPRLQGELVRARCAFGEGRAFLLLALRHAGRTQHRLLCLDREARLVAEAEAFEGDGSWLGAFPELCAAGVLLFAATDDGLVRAEVRGGKIELVRLFPDTEPFVDGATRLLLAPGGLVAAAARTLRLLRLG